LLTGMSLAYTLSSDWHLVKSSVCSHCLQPVSRMLLTVCQWLCLGQSADASMGEYWRRVPALKGSKETFWQDSPRTKVPGMQHDRLVKCSTFATLGLIEEIKKTCCRSCTLQWMHCSSQRSGRAGMSLCSASGTQRLTWQNTFFQQLHSRMPPQKGAPVSQPHKALWQPKLHIEGDACKQADFC